MSALRVQGGQERAAMRPFPPVDHEHPSVGQDCAACGREIEPGAILTVIPLGPGADEEAQETARSGGWYSALGVIAHAACAGLDERRLPDSHQEGPRR